MSIVRSLWGQGDSGGIPLCLFLVLLVTPFLGAQTSGSAVGRFPVITRLDSRDAGFKQYIADVEANRRRVFNRERTGESPLALVQSLTIYQYSPEKDDDIFFLAARCNIPYSAITSLNHIRHPSLLETGMPLLLPSSPGIFIPAEPDSDLERLLAAARFPEHQAEAVSLTVGRATADHDIEETFLFYPGSDFTSTERAFFLNAAFRFPLRSFRLTSSFGMRQNPVTGNIRLHQGMDFAAPAGTEVFAAGDGIVTETGNDPIYGKYIIIKHSGNWASLYGHLQKVETSLHSPVRSGNLIGIVGSTGQSTGPHLHFELRQNGKAQDPGKLLFQAGGQ